MFYYPHIYRTNNAVQRGRLAIVERAHGLAVELEDVKLHLRVDHDDEDIYIGSLIEAATEEIDAPRGWLGRSLLPRTMRLTLDDVAPNQVYLPGPPIIEIESVEYRDSNDDFQTVTDYKSDLLAEPGLIWVNTCWNSKGGTDSFRVTYQAGYETADDIPRLVRQWIMMRVGDLYRDRETSVLGTSQSQLKHMENALTNLRIR